ncbi:TrkH family potassium uptake protein [Alphaproteobacteria bacterium KMM 3653]|uniref:TrkH family potassium uptake protein n=1 Tax=Harenicola maris TaxID=2841044 RepID=A0AAP2G7X2_9RHOB|nr:TrkH family potassium uptake protein [Harenicola maris]
MKRVLDLPLFVILMGLGAVMMFVPVFHAVAVRDWLPARSFFYSGVLFSILTTLIGIATVDIKPRILARSHLSALLATFVVLPAMLAVPFYEGLQTTTFLNAYFEMVSSLTTTGLTLFAPDRLPDTLHLWRALIGWLGGFLMWVAAIAIMWPLNLGGFEVISNKEVGAGMGAGRGLGGQVQVDARERLVSYAARFFPIYAGLTLLLWLGLVILGDNAFTAVCHAMSVLATSAISPVGGLAGSTSGIGGEALIFIFFAFAISRKTFSLDSTTFKLSTFQSDSEVRLGAFFAVLIPSLLFLRHWIGAYEVDDESDLLGAFGALWGGVFSTVSFLTTTGFESAEWQTARNWSGLQTPGLILAGLALIGGGVATTAGGVKLLRVYALYKHGVREMERLVHPHSVGGSGSIARQLRRRGAFVAWVFAMLFALAFAAVAVLLAAAGLNFDQAMVLSVASLSNTGPVAAAVLEQPIDPAGFSALAKSILCAAMVLGRLEALVIIALLNPEFWRR